MKESRSTLPHVGEQEGLDLRSRLAAVDLGRVLARHSHWVAVAILILGLLFYLRNLDAWLMDDDEESYLYAAWRISEGEMPYRDFLTPQLPVFLYSGATLMKLFGPSVAAARAFSVGLIILSAGCLYLATRRFFRPEVGLLAMTAFLLHKDVYQEGRLYRPEPYMLFLILAGLCLFVWADGWSRRRRWGLAGAGFLFGLGMLTKLFSLMALGGCVAFLGYRALRGDHQASWREALLDALALLIPFGLVVGLVIGGFYWATPQVYIAVLGHQLMQGRGLSRWAIFEKGLQFYWAYFTRYAPLLVFALPAAAQSLWRERGRRGIFAWYLPTALIFLFLSRELWPRHLLYLVPSLCVLFAHALEPMLAWRGRGFLLIAVVGAVLIPWGLQDDWLARQWENGTWRLADYIAGHTAPDDYVLADYSGLNFYARRKSTYSGASLSAGATRSGQITGQRLIEEIEANDVKMVILDTSEFAHHQYLRDRRRFLDYLETHFRFQGTFRRYWSIYSIYLAPDLSPRLPEVNFDGQLTLLSADLDGDAVPAGGQIGVRLRWQARQLMTEDYVAFLHLEDEAGHLWGQGDGPLRDSKQEMTSGWLPDEINVDRYKLKVLPGTPPGEYQLRVGLYRRADLSRLNLLGTSGNPVGTEFAIGKLRVTRPDNPPSIEALEIPHPLAADLGDTVRLLGYAGLDEETTRAGETISLSLFWEALRDIPAETLLRLELRDGAGRLAASQLSPPASDAFPTSQWQKGDVVRGRYDLLVDAAASAGRYQLQINWVEAATGQPLAEADIPLAQVEVAELERQFERPDIQHPLRADLGERIALLGYGLRTPQVEPGGTVELALYWQARGRVGTSYTVFTHLLDGEERIRGQRDSLPAGGARPTTGWLPGEVIVDEYAFPVDADALPGDYILEIGMYDALTGERLPVVVEEARVPGDRVLLGKVEVR